MKTLGQRAFAEGLGTALLVATVVGSGIMAERLAGGNVALALLANTLATGAALVALIVTCGPISGAHLNPVVSLASAVRGTLPWPAVPAYVGAQSLGAVGGTILSHFMFGLEPVSWSTHARDGAPQLLSEVVATFGLASVIFSCERSKTVLTPFAVAAFIIAAYWFTASTSFANPAVTLARALTDTFAGIRPADVPGFCLAQVVGGGAAVLVWRWLSPSETA